MFRKVFIPLLFAVVTGQDGCKAPAIVSSAQGVVESPYYEYFPNFTYPINSKCRWTLIVPDKKNIQINFSGIFDTEGTSGSSCSYDFVTLYAPSRGAGIPVCSRHIPSQSTVVYGPFCGKQTPPVFVVGNNSVDVEFCTDSSQNGQGFQLNFTATDQAATSPEDVTHGPPVTTAQTTSATSPTCSGNFTVDGTNPVVFIESPNHPQDYPSNIRCSWIITGPPGKSLQIDAISFELEGSTGCRYDSLSVIDLTVGSELGKFCGTKKWRLRSTGNKVEIFFQTDSSGTYPGFYLSVKEPICEADLDACPNDPNFETCFSPDMLCDGNADCPGGADENCPQGCGVPQRKPLLSTRNARVSGGIAALPHSWPWHVVVSDSEGFIRICGGAIIDHHWVVTADYCCSSFFDNEAGLAEYSIRVGEHDLDGDREPHAISYGVQKIIRRQFSTGSAEVCLMKTKMPIFFNSDVSPVCLPTGFDPPSGTRCYATGWGNEGDDSNRTLRQVDLQIGNATYCRTASYNGFQFTPEMICTNPNPYKNLDCESDRGGPLVCQSEDDPNRWELVGVQAFNPCMQNDAVTPSVFARTSFVLDWIGETVLSN